KRKYGPDVAGVLAFLAEARAERDTLQRLDEDAERLTAVAAELTTELAALAATITDARKLAAAELSTRISPLLGRLGMPSAEFTAFVGEAPRHGPHGADVVEFRFSANPGEAPTHLAQIASGGELSRVMLALHLVTGTTHETLAFDEIDSGVGGRAAQDVGALLAALAQGRQVLVVTHPAQVAAFADHQYVVRKALADGRTVTSGRRRDEADRPDELARMLSGTVTRASLEHARELMDAARSTKAHEPLDRVE